jgi:hypothetical protein
VKEEKPFSYDEIIDEDDDDEVVAQHENLTTNDDSQKSKEDTKEKVKQVDEEDTFGDVVYIDNQREIPENPFTTINQKQLNGGKVGFIAPVAAVGILDYLFAADLLVNLEYRVERMLKFSRTSI